MKKQSRMFWTTATAVLTLISSGPVVAKDAAKVTPPATVVDSLNVAMDSWYDATLSGNNGRCHEYEQKVVRLLKADIDRTQTEAFRLSEQVKGTTPDSEAVRPSLTDSVSSPLRDSLDFLLSELHVKRILLESMTRSGAFSNKYRLLGDYVELLRREVGLPKLKLAAERKSDTRDN
jgi:hypothetical protein